jgi:hypothetical protein
VLSLTSIIIPIRYDSWQRQRNFEQVLANLRNIRNIELIVVECDTERKIFPEHLVSSDCALKYQFVQDANFNRSRLLNIGAMISNRPFICIQDPACIMEIGGYCYAQDMLQHNGYKMAIPYQYFWNLDEGDTYNLINNGMEALTPLNCPSDAQKFLGGIYMLHKDTFIGLGGMLEDFEIGGYDDDEIKERFWRFTGGKVVNHQSIRCYHLQGNFDLRDDYGKNRRIFELTKIMSNKLYLEYANKKIQLNYPEIDSVLGPIIGNFAQFNENNKTLLDCCKIMDAYIIEYQNNKTFDIRYALDHDAKNFYNHLMDVHGLPRTGGLTADHMNKAKMRYIKKYQQFFDQNGLEREKIIKSVKEKLVKLYGKS